MEFIIDNKEWIFSGIGVVVLAFIFRLIFKKKQEKEKRKNYVSNSKVKSSGNVRVGDEGPNHNNSDSKNIFKDGEIDSGGDVHIGDKSSS